MLILSRKQGDAILIDGGIRIVVLASDSGGVRLGIEAPPSIGIVREELVRDITDENIRAGAKPEDKVFLEALSAGAGTGPARGPDEVGPAAPVRGAEPTSPEEDPDPGAQGR